MIINYVRWLRLWRTNMWWRSHYRWWRGRMRMRNTRGGYGCWCRRCQRRHGACWTLTRRCHRRWCWLLVAVIVGWYRCRRGWRSRLTAGAVMGRFGSITTWRRVNLYVRNCRVLMLSHRRRRNLLSTNMVYICRYMCSTMGRGYTRHRWRSWRKRSIIMRVAYPRCSRRGHTRRRRRRGAPV